MGRGGFRGALATLAVLTSLAGCAEASGEPVPAAPGRGSRAADVHPLSAISGLERVLPRRSNRLGEKLDRGIVVRENEDIIVDL